MNVRMLIAGACLLALYGVRPAGAQEATRCPPPAAVDTAGRKPGLVVRASARADRVRFETRPELSVRLLGCPVADTVRVLERVNLPDPVEPGATYRDVRVSVEIRSYLDVRCLLADAARTAPGDSVPGSPLAALCPPASAPADSAAARRR